MRVYHFLPANWALDDIRRKRIKISVIDELNDPFELWCVEQPDKRLRQALRGFKAEMVARFGMICFSKPGTIHCCGVTTPTSIAGSVLGLTLTIGV